MRCSIAGPFVPAAVTGAASVTAGLAFAIVGKACATADGVSTATGAAGMGVTTDFGCSVWAEGPAQPRKNASPMAKPKWLCRTHRVFIKLQFCGSEIFVTESRFTIHYRLAFSIAYSVRR